jgi:hypothetical protein
MQSLAKRILKKKGKLKSAKLITLVIPLTGAKRDLWLDGHYGSVIDLVIDEANEIEPGRVQSIRLIINDRYQRRALSPYTEIKNPVTGKLLKRGKKKSHAEIWSTFMDTQSARQITEFIDGFVLRILPQE